MQKLIQEALKQKREALLRKHEVLRLLGMSNSSFYAFIKAGKLPPGVPIGPRDAAPVFPPPSYSQ